MGTRLVTAVALLSLVDLGCRSGPISIGEGVENIILISIDALNPSALSAYEPSAERLPNLDAFAERAVVFDNAYSTASWTLPAHASMLTGLYPDRHGAVRPGTRLGRDQVTLASMLRDAGFETVGFTGRGYMSGGYGFGVGFDRFNGYAASPSFRPSLALHERGESDGDVPFRRGVQYLESLSDGAPPFFLFLHTYDVHDYFQGNDPGVVDDRLKGCLSDVPLCSEEDWEQLERSYHERLSAFDPHVGRLMETLRKTGLDRTTVLVLTSDHGEGFDIERGRVHHTGRLHRDMIRVPLWIVAPGVAPARVAEDVSLVDVAPTLLAIAGASVATSLDGVSVADSVYARARSARTRRALFAMEHAYDWLDGVRVDVRPEGGQAVSEAVVGGGYHYIRSGDREELYDLRKDENERANLVSAPEFSEHLSAVRALLERRADFETRGETMELDDALRDELRALGYLP